MMQAAMIILETVIEIKKGNSGLITLVRQGIKYTITSRSIAICWLLETQYRDLRRGYSN